MSQPPQLQDTDEQLLIGFCYVGLVAFMIPTFVLFLMKKDENPTIRFHALNALALGLASFVLNIGITIANIILSMIPLIGWLFGLLGMLVSLALFGYWIYICFQAFTGKDTTIPVITEFVKKKWC